MRDACPVRAAKYGAVGLVRALSLEIAASGSIVNAICSGFIDTPMLGTFVANIMGKTGKSYEAAAKSLSKGHPQKRFIEVDQIAAAALYLCSPAAWSVKGHTLNLMGDEI